MTASNVIPGTFPEREERGRSSWWPQDFENVLDGTWTPPQPTIGLRADGVGLFYPGKDHTIVSESEGGKTWMACLAAIDEVQAGSHVVYIDFEGDAGGLVNRLLLMGATREHLRERFHYIRPNEQQRDEDLAEAIHTYMPTLVVLDGITEAMTMNGLNPLDNKEVAMFGQQLPKKLMRLGPAVVSLDHVPKSNDNRGRYAIGGVHKLNGLDGAAYVLTNKAAFGVGITGRSRIEIAKDRHGQLRCHGLASSGMHWFGDLVVKSIDDGIAEVSIEAPHARDENWKPTEIMQKLADVLDAKAQPLSQRVLMDLVKGGSSEIKRTALSNLIADGYVSAKTPHQLLKPYTAPRA